MSEALLGALRGLRVADPDLGAKPLLAKLREQQPDLGAGTREVREALKALKAEGEATASAAAAAAAAAAGPPPAADEGDAPSTAALSLASAASGCRRIWTKNGRSTQSSSSSTTAAHGLLCRSFQHNELAERMALPKPIVQHSSS